MCWAKSCLGIGYFFGLINFKNYYTFKNYMCPLYFETLSEMFHPKFNNLKNEGSTEVLCELSKDKKK